ncbi:MAG: hypothetical protein ABI954_10095 [Pyrinomonadaceae bacterium]
MVNENLISTLEQSLRQIRQSRTQKVSRLREIEGEADNLKQEVAALDSSAEQIEKTIHSLLFSVRSNKNAQKPSPRPRERDLEIEMEMRDYDDALDLDEIMTRYSAPPKKNQPNYGSSRSVVPMHRSGGSKNDIPSANPNIEVRSYRFRDRTITQACSVLMRESNRSLHVNEIYNRLIEGGMIFTGNNPTISIAVSLNRNRRFRKVAPGTFDLVMRDASQAAS